MRETIFILGREPELSVAELEAMAPDWSATVEVLSPEAALVRHPEPLPELILNRLGGSLKQVNVVERWTVGGEVAEMLHEKMTESWLLSQFPTGRVEYGVSLYGGTGSIRQTVQRIALGLKKKIAATERAVRFVSSREPQLSTVTVQRNGLVKKGREIIFIVHENEILVGVTIAVQDYQLYGLRDFGRPAANAKSGMLPPKLAQMMLHLAKVQPNDVLLDPYCGSGTVLQEAILLGVKKMYGSDVEAQAVKDSRENIAWLLKEFSGHETDLEITVGDARGVRGFYDVIVTEPYLGKPLRGHEPKDWLTMQAKELGQLYVQCLQSWRQHLKDGGRVVMIWPEFTVGAADVTIDIDGVIAGLGYQPQHLLSANAAKALKVSDRHVLTYAREKAKVRRQIRSWVRG